MTLHGLSDRFLAAVAGDHRWRVKVEVHEPNGTLVKDVTEYVLGGSVTVDETAEIRRTCSVVIKGDPTLLPSLTTGSTLDPDNDSDVDTANPLFHPATGNEMWIFRGVEYPDGSTEYAQLGVFRMSKPQINDDGAALSFTINGQDRASVIARIGWQFPYSIPTGSNPAFQIQTAMQSRYAGLSYNFTNVTFTFPPTTFGSNPVAQSDPMSDLITFAAAAACELFFDVFGVATFRQITNPTTAVIVDDVHFVEGENCTMTSASRTLDETTSFNGVIINCNGTGAALPFTVAVWDTNPDSPTYYKGPWGQVPYIMTTTTIPAGSDTLSQATVKAETMALAQLQLVLGAFDNVSLTCIPNPALREGDRVFVSRERMGIDASYVISGMTIPLDPASPMSVTFRPQVSAARAI